LMADHPDEDVGDFSVKQIATKYFLSCAAALVAETVTYPLDITKTRLQIARNKLTKGGMFQVTYDIIRREGAMSLWTGVGPAITRHYIYTGIRMGAYESLRGLNQQLSSKRILLLEAGKPSPLPKTLPDFFSNRVSAVGPAAVHLFKKLGVWERLEAYRTKKVNRLRVLDNCSRAELEFDQPIRDQVYVEGLLMIHVTKMALVHGTFDLLLVDVKHKVEKVANGTAGYS
ncbi:hypothetical protein TELCIR_16899, partial [Teladorsagia circumcincta]